MTHRQSTPRPNRQASNWTIKNRNFNKKSSIKMSFYNQLIFYGRISPESVKLNSTRKDFSERLIDENFITKREFKHTPTNTTISIRMSFSMLEEIQKQDLFKWSDEFKQTVKLAGWNDITAVEVLRSSIDSKYYSLIQDAATVDNIIDIILSHKYPASHYTKYLNMLSNVRQDDFLRIKEYKENKVNICKRLKICMGKTESQTRIKAEEVFYTGLSKRTQLEMSRLNVRNIVDIYEMINCTEETLKEQLDINESYDPQRIVESRKRKNNITSRNIAALIASAITKPLNVEQ
ncbi:hypothetical protein DMUE_0574 [Dictyocoela muelleri]|nr:hypothetical protein DMUE_0574 [Dictyocoela muelleri]